MLAIPCYRKKSNLIPPFNQPARFPEYNIFNHIYYLPIIFPHSLIIQKLAIDGATIIALTINKVKIIPKSAQGPTTADKITATSIIHDIGPRSMRRTSLRGSWPRRIIHCSLIVIICFALLLQQILLKKFTSLYEFF